MLGELGSDLGRDHHQTVFSIAAPDVGGVPELGREVLPAAVGQDADDDALVELGGEPARDVRDRTRRDAGEQALACRAGRARPATDSSFETSTFRSSFETSRIGGT